VFLYYLHSWHEPGYPHIVWHGLWAERVEVETDKRETHSSSQYITNDYEIIVVSKLLNASHLWYEVFSWDLHISCSNREVAEESTSVLQQEWSVLCQSEGVRVRVSEWGCKKMAPNLIWWPKYLSIKRTWGRAKLTRTSYVIFQWQKSKNKTPHSGSLLQWLGFELQDLDPTFQLGHECVQTLGTGGTGGEGYLGDWLPSYSTTSGG